MSEARALAPKHLFGFRTYLHVHLGRESSV